MIEKTGMRSVLIDHPGLIAGRMACVLAAMLLTCASLVHAQVIEEGGFPIKGEGISGESFSLSCPSRLVVEAGESLLLSCAATGVLEEGVRYRWESLSGDDLRLLSDAQSHSPLFTAPVSAAGAEYAYRLTATALGVYRTSTVTVSVQGASRETVRGPGLQEECDPLAIPDELGQGCAPWEHGSEPFGFGFEEEGGFLFPEAPGLPDRGNGSDLQAPPRLECPVAVFLEELETGQVECHAWDAAGEEYLEYTWEPVGSTTRDYLDNPRLIPEDSPTPSVIAPEAPVHETLESFLSGETTFRYRYRLTATSRATGLSSSQEVEVYVSSSRPVVYCPLEIVVAEGETVTLDCEGANPLSFRMDYDEEAASVLWEWEGLWGTSMAPLDATDLSSPLFTAPAGSAGKEYHYIASMTTSASGAPRTARRRVTVGVVGAEEAKQALAPASKGNAPSITCKNDEIYEATDDFTLDCSVTDAPDGAAYAWTARGSTSGTSELSSMTVLAPTFYVPDNINEPNEANKNYEYTVTMTAGGIVQASEDVTVTVLEKPDIFCRGELGDGIGGYGISLGVGETSKRLYGYYISDTSSFCHALTGAPTGSDYEFNWIPGDRFSSNPGPLSWLSATNVQAPVFSLPDDYDMSRDGDVFGYDVIISAENSDPDVVSYAVTILSIQLRISCKQYYAVDEGAEDFPLSCSASNAPSNLDYIYSWKGRWSADHVNRLDDPSKASPMFMVPDDVPRDMNYFFTLSVTVDHPRSRSASVNVRVLVRDTSTHVSCKDNYAVYEGSGDITLDCSAEREPDSATYSWTPRGNTSDTNLLSSTTVLQPTFHVPPDVSSDTEYKYTMTLSADGFDSATDDVTVTVLNKPSITVTCPGNPYEVYAGENDIVLDCSASGPPGGSGYTWSWSPADRLANRDTSSPTFSVPGNVTQDTIWKYTVVASAPNAEDGAATIKVKVLDTGMGVQSPVVTCHDSSVYEGSDDFDLRCTARNEPSGAAYRWTGTDISDRLRGTDGLTPTFLVPGDVDSETGYEYTVRLSASGIDDVTEDVTVTVLNKEALAVVCADPGSVYEGSADITFDCEASGAPGNSPEYAYVWTPRGDTQDTALLSATDIASPTFLVPDEVAATTTYEYRLTASAANAEDAMAEVSVTVLNKETLAVTCADPGSVYEGSEDITLDCSASGGPEDSEYAYVWTPRGDTQDTALLSATDIASPVFYVPGELSATTTYEYLLTVSAANAEDAMAEVSVTVLNKEALAVTCADPGSVYEGSEDITLDCSASGAPGDNSEYAYVWTARGDTQDTGLLSATDIASPTFLVPDEVAATTTYEYRLTASAANAEDAMAEVSVTVLNKETLAVTCADPGSVYEGSEDITFDCLASGAPGDNSEYAYVWTARGDTQDTSLLSATDIESPTFYVPDEVIVTTTYEYQLTASAANAEDAMAEVSVTVLNKETLAVTCADPGSVYEGSEDITLDCSASGAPSGSEYTYVWTARGDTEDTSLLSAAGIASPTFLVPDEVAATTIYEYRLTVSTANAESGSAEIAVTVLNEGALAVACTDPDPVYEGSEDITLDCSASGAPSGSEYTYVWTARGDTQDTSLLSATDIESPTFYVPDEVIVTTTYEYQLTASAANAEDAMAEVSVTVLNKETLAVTCADPGSVYEGSEDITLDCSASGGPEDSEYAYVWTPRGDTQDTALLSATDIASPLFFVPAEVDATMTYEYLLTVSAANAEDGTSEVSVTVLNRAVAPPSDPVTPPLTSSPSTREPSDPSALGVTVSVSALRFGVQSADTEVSLDPMTDGISTYVSGPYHAGRMTLSPGGGEAFDENGEMDLSIELTSPVVLKRADATEASSIVLSPAWSYAESCEQLSSQTIGGLYTEVTLSEEACRLLRFGGELDLTDLPSGRYAGNMDLILRSGEREETFAVEVDVTVVPAQRVITIGPGGVRFSTSRELPAGLTEEQNLSIYPDVAFLTEEKPHGVFELSNPSLIPLEVLVSARFGYTEATENGREVVVEDVSQSRLSDLSEVVDIHPGVLVLQPGEKGLIRYGVKEEAHAVMAEKGYAAFFDVVSQPRQYADLDQMPEEVTGDRTARVTMRVPGVYVPGEGASQLRATLLSISYVGSLSATFLLETADHPFAGEVVAYDGDGRELGRRETLVYTRSRVRVPLDRIPEEGAVFLRFVPRGPGRIPEPAPVRWNAPRRDVGAARGHK